MGGEGAQERHVIRITQLTLLTRQNQLNCHVLDILLPQPVLAVVSDTSAHIEELALLAFVGQADSNAACSRVLVLSPHLPVLQQLYAEPRHLIFVHPVGIISLLVT